MLSTCIHEKELYCEDDDNDVFEEVQNEEEEEERNESLPRSRFPELLESE